MVRAGSIAWLRACLLACLLACLSAWTAGPSWAGGAPDLPAPWTGYQEMYEAAAEEHRPMVIFFHTPWCFYCKKMKKRVLNQPRVLKALEGRAWAASVDLDREPALKDAFRVGRVPTLLFLDPGGREISRFEGYVGVEGFLEALGQAEATR